MNTYSSPQLAALFKRNEQTIRRWSDEFAEYLSIHATPGEGRARQFTDEDLPVLALIASMKATKAEYRDIHAALENGERGEVPENINAIIPSPDRSSLQIDLLTEQLQDRERELIRVQAMYESEQSAHQRTQEQSAQALKELESRLQAAQDEIAKLNREIGRLEGKLDHDTR